MPAHGPRTAGVQAGAKSSITVQVKHGKPDIPPRGGRRFRKERCGSGGQRNAGESKGRSVMERLGVALTPLRKQAHFQHSRSLRENL